VPHKGWDVILFAGIAVVVACLSQGPYSSLIVLLAGEEPQSSADPSTCEAAQLRPRPAVPVRAAASGAGHGSPVWATGGAPGPVPFAGGALMGFVYPFNLKEIGNGVALWLGIEPYELFFYIFLPPLLLDAALKLDWYVFKKVSSRSRQTLPHPAPRLKQRLQWLARALCVHKLAAGRAREAVDAAGRWRRADDRLRRAGRPQVVLNVVTLAFLVVMGTCAVLIPVMLYVFWLKPRGWAWYDAALFGSMIASTDAVAIVAVLKKSAPLRRRRVWLASWETWCSREVNCTPSISNIV